MVVSPDHDDRPCDVEFRAVTKRFGSLTAVNAVSLRVRQGEFMSLLGPSGCGKTTSLRLIAGFEQPDEGEILIGGSDAVGSPPYKREVNTVFQHYALFPHMSVLDNVAYGLKQRRVAKPQRHARAREALELVQLTGRETRRPAMLSGGQQQRVALARALVLQPSVLLLDEPLGALDAKLRRALKVELKALQEQVGITFLYVTHDQEEALTMSDRLAVMRDGKIVQVGVPHEVYEEPADTYVADFLGVSNLMEVDVVERGPGAHCTVRLGESVLEVEHGAADAADRSHAVIRPERVRVEEFGSAGPNRVPAMVERLVYLGSATQVILRLAPGAELQVLLQNDGTRETLAQGTPVHAYLAPDALRVLGGDGRADDTADDALKVTGQVR